MKKTIPVISGILAAAMILTVAGCGGGGGGSSDWHGKEEWLKAYDAPTAAAVLPTSFNGVYGTVAVHDPSVFHDPKSGKYYAFGTHFAVAESADLIYWTQTVAEGSSAPEKLYGQGVDWKTILKQGVAHTEGSTGTTWAPDVEYIGGKYYMYVSLTTAFGSSKSIIMRVSSNNVLGPYRNEQVIVESDGSGHSNAIDPELFYDKDGRLWMVYGSAFGNLYIKELYSTGKNAGLPIISDPEDENYLGAVVWKGEHNDEGPFIFYNAETDYYYMMCSYGSLSSSYNMRVARSKTPEGDRYDKEGNLVEGSGYQDIAGHYVAQEGGGNKLAGNYQFNGGPTDTALGHNSVIKSDGKYLVVMHVRNQVDGMHHVEVRQLFFNKEGWPVLAPNRYAGESLGVVTAEQVAGTYDVVLHTDGTTANYAKSVSCTFAADGTVSGGMTGTWSLGEEGYYITMTLGGVTYSGVVAPQYKSYGTKGAIFSITATSDTGRPIWANGAVQTA